MIGVRALLLLNESELWTWLDRGSIVLSYLVVLSIAAFIFSLFRYRRKRRELSRFAGKSQRPQALAISFGGSIKQAVDDYLKAAYPDAIVPVEEYEAGEVTTENIHRHEEEIRRLKERFQSENVTELHLFMKGPVALALAVGAIFDNWVMVKIYHNNRTGNYEPWTTLHQAKALAIRDELAERVTQVLDVKAQAQ